MKYYRVSYDGYTEGEYEDRAAAIKDFVECVQDDLDDSCNTITVEVYNEDTEKWEVAMQ